MRTHDPFLRHLLAAIDRALMWAVLSAVFSALSWTAAWERGLGLPALDGWRLLGRALLGQPAERTALTLLALCATVVGGWLYRRWQRKAELDVQRLRGVRWEGDR
jgi:hypothetical protein